MTPRLKETYSKEIQPALKDSLGLKNIFMVPRIEKIVLNMGLGLDGADAKILKAAEEDMGKITGQKPVVTKFKKSVANFKTRKGSNAGLKVLVLTGKDKKKESEVIELDRRNNREKDKEINMVKKHVKTTKEKKGGIVSKESFIHLSNLKVIDEKVSKKAEDKK